MVHHLPYSPSRDLCSEDLRVGVPLDMKRALADAARREGRSVSAIVRQAVTDALGGGQLGEPSTRPTDDR